MEAEYVSFLRLLVNYTYCNNRLARKRTPGTFSSSLLGWVTVITTYHTVALGPCTTDRLALNIATSVRFIRRDNNHIKQMKHPKHPKLPEGRDFKAPRTTLQTRTTTHIVGTARLYPSSNLLFQERNTKKKKNCYNNSAVSAQTKHIFLPSSHVATGTNHFVNQQKCDSRLLWTFETYSVPTNVPTSTTTGLQ